MKKDISDSKNDLFVLKSDFSKLEADMSVTRNVKTKLPEKLVTMARRCYACYANKQYSRRECLQMSTNFGYACKPCQ